MKKGSCAKIKSALQLGMLICAIMSCGIDTPLSEYIPSSDQEAAVKSVLLEFQDNVNRQDAGKVAGRIHEDALLMLGRERRRHSKSDYIKILHQRLDVLRCAQRRKGRADHHDPFRCRPVRRMHL